MTERTLRERIDAMLAAWRDGRVSKASMEERIERMCRAADPGAAAGVTARHPSPAVRVLLEGRCHAAGKHSGAAE